MTDITIQNSYRSNSGDMRIQLSGRIQYVQITEVCQGMDKVLGMTLGEEILEAT